MQDTGGGAEGGGGVVLAAVAGGELGHGAGDGFGTLFALLEAGAGFGELGFFVGGGGQGFQFGGGVAEEFFLAAGGGDGGLGRVEAFLGGAPGAVARGELGAEVGGEAEEVPFPTSST